MGVNRLKIAIEDARASRVSVFTLCSILQLVTGEMSHTLLQSRLEHDYTRNNNYYLYVSFYILSHSAVKINRHQVSCVQYRGWSRRRRKITAVEVGSLLLANYYRYSEAQELSDSAE